jgi:branched-chain amino acid transport system permease protein
MNPPTPSPLDCATPTLIGRTPGWSTWGVNLAIVAIIAILWPLGKLLDNQLDPYWLSIVILAGINVTLATSLNLINGVTGQFSLGHAGFMAIGAYASGALCKHYLANTTGFSGTAGFVATLLAGGSLAAVAGLLIGIPSLRLSGDYLAIATLGFGEIIRILVTQTQSIGPLEIGGASGLHDIPIRPASFNFFWTFTIALICVVCMWRIVHSVRGKNFLAVREDEIAAAATGVNTTYTKVLAFVIGAFFAGMAGGLFGSLQGNLDPQYFNFMLSVVIVAMVVLGGSGSITGGIVAAVGLTILPEALRYLNLEGPWRMILYSALLIVTMLLRPEGLLGRRELWWTRDTLPDVLPESAQSL